MKILDCTIRDGGYYTNWDFDSDTVKTYLKSLNHLPIEYIEVGYRSIILDGYRGEYFYSPLPTLTRIKESSNKKLAIILNEKDIRPEHVDPLLYPCVNIVDMIRLAVNPLYFERALKLAKKVKELGFEVCLNIMYMSEWEKHSELELLFPKIEDNVDYIYMVDSFGGIFPDDIKKTIKLIKSKTNVKIGFHGHDNLQMALANTLVAIDEGVDIVDATITGIGRGAGNLKMELLLTVLNSKGLLDVDYNWLSKVTNPFHEMQKDYEWGTNLPYMVAGANSIPQNQVMEWVSKRFYSFNSIIRALSNQSLGIEDNEQFKKLELSLKTKSKRALLVGGGTSVTRHSTALHIMLEDNPDIVVVHASSKNSLCFEGIDNKQYYCLVGNEGYRLEEVYNDKKVIGTCIIPPFPRKMGTYIPKALIGNTFELEKISFTEKFSDSHTGIALQLIKDLGVAEVFVVGYDGYSKESINTKEHELFIENDYLFERISDSLSSFISLTPTKYSNLSQQSIYQFII